jgi:putative acetyltransferase
LGESIVIVLGHPQFSSRFGFEPSAIYGIESPFAVPEEFFRVKPLKNYQERLSIHQLSRKCKKLR